MTIDSCEIVIETITIGGDYNRKDEDNYIYVPKDQLSGTYTKVDPFGDRTITIVRNGLTVTYTEEGQDYLLEIELAYSNDYNNFTINGEEIEDNLDSCGGTATGSGIRVGTVGVTIGFNYLQYRSPWNDYAGWIEATKDGLPIEDADVNKIELKDSNDDTVDIIWTEDSFRTFVYFKGEWNPQASSVDFSGPTFSSGFIIGFPGMFELPADNYTWGVTTSDNKLVEQQINYPGQKVIPFVDILTMESVWQNGSLVLSWTNPPNNPPGDYDEVVVFLGCDASWMLFAYLPTYMSEMTIPSEWVEIFRNFYAPTNTRWMIQLRSLTAEGMNYARGISDLKPIPDF